MKFILKNTQKVIKSLLIFAKQFEPIRYVKFFFQFNLYLSTERKQSEQRQSINRTLAFSASYTYNNNKKNILKKNANHTDILHIFAT